MYRVFVTNEQSRGVGFITPITHQCDSFDFSSAVSLKVVMKDGVDVAVDKRQMDVGGQ